MIPDEAVEALARVLAGEALFNADIAGTGWDAETDSSDHFMPNARKRAIEYLEAAAPHMLAEAWESGWANARGTYSALYRGMEIPEWVTLLNPYGAPK